MNATTFAKAGWSTYSSVKDAVKAAAHPVQWAKDQLIGLLAKGLLQAFTSAFGHQMAVATLERLNVVDKAFPLSFGVPVPRKAASLLNDPENLAIAMTVVNEVLAGPLEVLGYRIGQVDLVFDDVTSKLSVDLKLGLLSDKGAQATTPSSAVVPVTTPLAGPDPTAAQS